MSFLPGNDMTIVDADAYRKAFVLYLRKGVPFAWGARKFIRPSAMSGARVATERCGWSIAGMRVGFSGGTIHPIPAIRARITIAAARRNRITRAAPSSPITNSRQVWRRPMTDGPTGTLFGTITSARVARSPCWKSDICARSLSIMPTGLVVRAFWCGCLVRSPVQREKKRAGSIHIRLWVFL